MITSTQTKNNESFIFIAVLVFKLLSNEILLINRKKTIEEKVGKNKFHG